MILHKYLLKRFFKYLLLINSLLIILFNSIDFFEKFINIKNVQTCDIAYTILLNLLPSFFEYLPLSCWLVTALLIKELNQQNEWEILPLLNIKYQNIFSMFLATGLFLAVFSFIGNEQIANNLLYKSEQFKKEKLKKKSNHKIVNKWFVLNNNTFCYFNALDLKEKEGTGLILLYLDSNFATKKIITSPNFQINKKEKEITLENGNIIIPHSNEQIKIEHKIIHQPGFFTQIQMFSEQKSLKQLFQTLLYSKNIITNNSWNELFHLFLKRILFYLQFILYPLLTLCLFFIPFSMINKYKWLLILLPYPVLTLFTALTDFFVQSGYSALLATTPYLILFITIFFLWKRITMDTAKTA